MAVIKIYIHEKTNKDVNKRQEKGGTVLVTEAQVHAAFGGGGGGGQKALLASRGVLLKNCTKDL